MQPDQAPFSPLHTYLVERLVPACADLLEAAVTSAERSRTASMPTSSCGRGNLCIRAYDDPRYDARRLVRLLMTGLLSDGGIG
jgi:hypothetical protein